LGGSFSGGASNLTYLLSYPVIIQQIYQRYHLRQTRNAAFRHYWLAVRYLDRRCRRIIRRSRG
jgi:hypothetical protein